MSPRASVEAKPRRHIALADYEHEVPPAVVAADERPSIEQELGEALPDDKLRAEQVLTIDCPDCGRTLAFRGKCGKCTGRSWVPAGHVDRVYLKSVREAKATSETEPGGES